MKQMEFTILGQSYVLACPDGGEQTLQQAVAAVDREMGAIRDAGKVKARERMAVLAALNLAYSLADRDLPSETSTSRAASGSEQSPAAPSSSGASAPSAAVDLSGLIRRLDETLREDGQLL